MKRNKIHLLFAILLMTCRFSFAQIALNVDLSNNATNSYQLTKVRSLIYKSGNLKVNKLDSTTDNYAYTTLRDVNFSSSITEVKTVSLPGNFAVLYPNPITQYLNVKVAIQFESVVEIKLFDIIGNEILDRSFQGKVGINEFTINELGNLSSGAYYVQVKSNNTLETHKTIKI